MVKVEFLDYGSAESSSDEDGDQSSKPLTLKDQTLLAAKEALETPNVPVTPAKSEKKRIQPTFLTSSVSQNVMEESEDDFFDDFGAPLAEETPSVDDDDFSSAADITKPLKSNDRRSNPRSAAQKAIGYQNLQENQERKEMRKRQKAAAAQKPSTLPAPQRHPNPDEDADDVGNSDDEKAGQNDGYNSDLDYDETQIGGDGDYTLTIVNDDEEGNYLEAPPNDLLVAIQKKEEKGEEVSPYELEVAIKQQELDQMNHEKRYGIVPPFEREIAAKKMEAALQEKIDNDDDPSKEEIKAVKDELAAVKKKRIELEKEAAKAGEKFRQQEYDKIDYAQGKEVYKAQVAYFLKGLHGELSSESLRRENAAAKRQNAEKEAASKAIQKARDSERNKLRRAQKRTRLDQSARMSTDETEILNYQTLFKFVSTDEKQKKANMPATRKEFIESLINEVSDLTDESYKKRLPNVKDKQKLKAAWETYLKLRGEIMTELIHKNPRGFTDRGVVKSDAERDYYTLLAHNLVFYATDDVKILSDLKFLCSNLVMFTYFGMPPDKYRAIYNSFFQKATYFDFNLQTPGVRNMQNRGDGSLLTDLPLFDSKGGKGPLSLTGTASRGSNKRARNPFSSRK